MYCEREGRGEAGVGEGGTNLNVSQIGVINCAPTKHVAADMSAMSRISDDNCKEFRSNSICFIASAVFHRFTERCPIFGNKSNYSSLVIYCSTTAD